MSKVVAIMSMSLDGSVADRNGGVAEVFDWYMNSGDVEFHTGGGDPMTFKVSEPSAEHLRGLWAELGAVLTGRKTFDTAEGWGGNHVAAVFLGSEVRFFEHLADTPSFLGNPSVIQGVGVTHLRYPVRKGRQAAAP
jgi:hypothetical protein